MSTLKLVTPAPTLFRPVAAPGLGNVPGMSAMRPTGQCPWDLLGVGRAPWPQPCPHMEFLGPTDQGKW